MNGMKARTIETAPGHTEASPEEIAGEPTKQEEIAMRIAVDMVAAAKAQGSRFQVLVHMTDISGNLICAGTCRPEFELGVADSLCGKIMHDREPKVILQAQEIGKYLNLPTKGGN